MNSFTIWALLIIHLFGCNLSPTSKYGTQGQSDSDDGSYEILFHIKTTNKDYLEIFEDGIIPWISIKEPEKQLHQLIGRDEIVLTTGRAVLLIDYPLNNPVEMEIISEKLTGFTRGELIVLISREYKRIYQEEEKTAKIKTIQLEERVGVINRNETNGKYGIWGHDLKDLDLSAIIVHLKRGKKARLELYIES